MERFLVKSKKRSLSPESPKRPIPSTSSVLSESDSDNSDADCDIVIDTDDNIQNAAKLEKKKRLFVHRFRDEWLDEFPWVEKRKDGQAYCKCCHTIIVGGTTHLKRHAKSTKHTKKMIHAKSCQKLNDFIEDKERVNLDKSSYRGELKMTLFLHEHNLPFALMEHLPKLVASICPDSKIARKFNCGKTKATALTNECLAQESLNLLKKGLHQGGGFYSLIINETTDVSIKKSLVVIIRLYHQEIKDKFLSLTEVESATAECLFNSILKVLAENEIVLNNMLGFAADNASVMMGSKSGIQAKFKEINQDMFVLGCTCHSLHLCSSAACSKLPKSLEEFVRNLYNHFANSPKRISEFEQFQEFVDLKPHKMLKPSQTRWLSLQAVVDRVLTLWDALTLYFTNYIFEKKDILHMDENLLENLKNPAYKLYLLFLSYILDVINTMNLQFQSESTQICNLHTRSTSLYKSVLRNFMKKEIIDNVDLSRINPANPDYYLRIENIYMGGNAALFLNEEKISPSEMNKIYVNILGLYVELCLQIRKRFNFQDDFLKYLTNFQPKIALGGEIPTICEAGTYFKVLNLDLNKLDTEWRLLQDIDELKNNCHLEFDAFWTLVFNSKNELNLEMFPNLTKLVKAIMCLPHSSAAAERTFSKLNIIKTKLRNKLQIKTCNSILLSLDMLGKDLCYSWEPSPNILSRKPKYK